MAMNNIIKNIYKLQDEGQHNLAINYGESELNFVKDKLSKGYIYKALTTSYYELAQDDKFIHACNLAVAYMPREEWKERLRVWGGMLFAMHYSNYYSDSQLARKHFMSQKIIDHIIPIYTKEKIKEWSIIRKNNNNKIKIGYISQDFVCHVNMSFSIHLLDSYNRNDFEVYCYMMNRNQDAISEYIRSQVDNCEIVGISDPEAIAKQIYEDEIDILFDISVHAGNSRTLSVIAYKPAPIIIAGIGYMSTSGIKNIDYFLTDVNCDPEGMGDDLFSEKLLRLPHSHFCYKSVLAFDKYEVNKKIHNPIHFGSLNNYRKLNNETLKVWYNIMERIPDSKLILQSTGTELLKNALIEKMLKIGFDMTRIEMRSPSNKYLATYHDIDIALDTYPYVGGGTTCDALYMGVPVITMCGTRHGTRFGYSIMKNIGLETLVVDSWKNYEDMVVTLAENPKVLEELHCTIREMMCNSPLMDKKIYVNAVEDKYKEVFQEILNNKGNLI